MQNEEPKPMKTASYWYLRILIACLFGCTIAYFSLNSARKQSEILIAREQNVNRYKFQSLGTYLDKYWEDKHKMPPDLDTLVSKGYCEKNDTIDGWKRPIIYRVRGDEYTLITYGRDGKLGGVGLDADQTSDNPRPKPSEMTFEQFLSCPEARDMVNWGIACGIAATLLCGVLVRPVTLKKENLPILVLGLFFLLIAISGVSAVITVLHIPSGH